MTVTWSDRLMSLIFQQSIFFAKYFNFYIIGHSVTIGWAHPIRCFGVTNWFINKLLQMTGLAKLIRVFLRINLYEHLLIHPCASLAPLCRERTGDWFHCEDILLKRPINSQFRTRGKMVIKHHGTSPYLVRNIPGENGQCHDCWCPGSDSCIGISLYHGTLPPSARLP